MASTLPVCLGDFEDIARRRLTKNAFDYYQSGANDEQTLRENEDAFLRYRLRPKLLRDVSRRDLRTTILGQEIAFPIAVAPTAMQRMAHSDGEVATARAASSLGTGFILSSWATSTIEEVAEACTPAGLHWFQLYVYRDRNVVRDLVKRAEREGYKALFVTVDTPVLGRRLADVRNKFSLPSNLRLANFNVNARHSSGVKNSDDSGLAAYVASLIDPSLNWEHIEWLKTITSMPIVLKGILTAEDARLAVKHNISGIVVSNHGARQLDGVLASIDALSEVVEAVRGSNIEVYLDGGVRKGTDVLKALALGARAVFIGRPVLWGLAYDGEAGVKKVLEIIREEFSLAMALSGCASVKDISPDLIKKEKFFVMSKILAFDDTAGSNKSLQQPVCLEDFKVPGSARLPKSTAEFFSGGADDELTLRDNQQAFWRYRLKPKLLRNVSVRDLRTTILGHEIAFPVCAAPSSYHKMAHSLGELATASAISSFGTCMALSHGSTTPFKKVADVFPADGCCWFQMYMFKGRARLKELIRGVERAGFKALLLTVDAPLIGKRRADLKNGFSVPQNFERFDVPKNKTEGSGHSATFDATIDASITWRDVDWLRNFTTLPVVLKGILTAEDAKEAVRHNVAGIMVSNHGGRQLDGVLATIDALPEVVEAVRGSNIEVYLDGGVRKGTDVLKALALGARAVFIGRPVLWGLAYDGEAGVRKVLEIIRDEFSLAMALSGCSSIKDITPDLVVRESQLLAKL